MSRELLVHSRKRGVVSIFCLFLQMGRQLTRSSGKYLKLIVLTRSEYIYRTYLTLSMPILKSTKKLNNGTKKHGSFPTTTNLKRHGESKLAMHTSTNLQSVRNSQRN